MKTRLLVISAILVNCVILILLLTAQAPVTEAQPAASDLSAQAVKPHFAAETDEEPPLIIRGQVLNGRAGLRVQVTLPGGQIVEEAFIGPDGWFAFPPLPAGYYLLQVMDEEGLPLELEAGANVTITPETAGVPVEYILPLTAPPQSADALPLPPEADQPPDVLPPPDAERPPDALPLPPDGDQPPDVLPPPPDAESVVIQANGYITGVVTAAGTGLPLSSIQVTAYTSSGNWAGSRYTSGTGAYSMTAPAGTYKVGFSDLFGSYAPEWYNNQLDFASANSVTVNSDSVTPNINAVLKIGGQITGQVTAVGTGLPLVSVFVSAYTSTTSSSYVAYGYTDFSGNYTIRAFWTLDKSCTLGVIVAKWGDEHRPPAQTVARLSRSSPLPVPPTRGCPLRFAGCPEQ